jgi:hypothetical protein
MAKREGPIIAIGYLATVVTGLLTAILVVITLLSLPDIRRYLRISSM